MRNVGVASFFALKCWMKPNNQLMSLQRRYPSWSKKPAQSSTAASSRTLASSCTLLPHLRVSEQTCLLERQFFGNEPIAIERSSPHCRYSSLLGSEGAVCNVEPQPDEGREISASLVMSTVSAQNETRPKTKKVTQCGRS